MKKNIVFLCLAGLLSLFVLASCENEKTEDIPAAAGIISGNNSAPEGEKITLTIAAIDRAETYRWYKDGAEVQNTAERTFEATESGTYKVAGVNAAGEGAASPDKILTFASENMETPAAAGNISGDDTAPEGEKITLTIAAIDRAQTYRWYKDGAEVQNTAERTFEATESGTYKVAGVNAAGEGAASPEKVLTFTSVSGTITHLKLTDDDTESEWKSAGFTFIDKDGDGYNWFFCEIEWVGEDNGCALRSESYSSDDKKALTPENYLIFPEITIFTKGTLHIIAEANDPDYYAEKFKVIISDAPITEDNCREAEVLYTYTLEGLSHLKTLDIPSEYDGKSIYLGICHFDCTDQFRLDIRRITVESER